MRQIVPPISIVQTILGAQKLTNQFLYQLSTHCMPVEQSEGVLLYHTLTGELLLLSHEEAALLGALPGPISPALGELVPRWFLRPEGADDMALADQTRHIAERFKKKNASVTVYTIFTTMHCNARCSYCFEAGLKKNSMTERTARDTAKYITAHCGEKPVRLEWSGGEPLVNVRAIDVITACLRQQGVIFHSTMVSNGYLFDEEIIQRARDDWNLARLQITLDGTEDAYNRRKAYVNPEGSPYRRVLRNIGMLLDAGVQVMVRLNMDRDNEQDLYALVDELAVRFAGKPGFGVYSMVIYEEEGIHQLRYTDEERRSYAQKRYSLQAYAKSKGIAGHALLKRGLTFNACAADNGTYTTVTPEGQLGRCAASKDSSIWGSIYSDETDGEALRQWKERKPPEDVCKACVVYPQCLRLKKCPHWREHCSPIERALREEKIRRAVLYAYEDWKAAGQV